MKTIYFTLVIAFVVTPFFAQIQQVNNGSLNELVFYVGTNADAYDAEAEGSRYLDEAFTPAKINDIKETQFVRFNAVESTIEIKDKNNKILTLSKSYDYVVKFLDGSDKTYETYSFLAEDGTQKTTFFEKLYTTEKYTLFLKERIIYVPAKKAKSSYEQDIPGKFKKGNAIFYITDPSLKTDKLFEFPKKRKKRSPFFKDHIKSIEKFIKREGLKMDRKEDIVKIMNFYFRQD